MSLINHLTKQEAVADGFRHFSQKGGNVIFSVIGLSPSLKNRGQLLEILRSVVDLTRPRPGCVGCWLSEEEFLHNHVLYAEQWETEEALHEHIRSDLYLRLLSAIELSQLVLPREIPLSLPSELAHRRPDILAAEAQLHAATAAEVFEISREEVDVGQRSKAKMVNFGIVYGLTGFGLADRLNIPRKEGEEFVARYLERFPAVRRFREEVIERAQEEGYVTTLMGRRRPIPELRSGNPNTRRLGERLAVNTVIQGTAADIIKVAMVRCWARLREERMQTRLVLQIHDELLFEGPPEEMDAALELVRTEMTTAYQLDPPLEVDAGVGTDWLNAK